MPLAVRRAKYYYAIVDDKPGMGVELLAKLRVSGVSLLAFTTFPLENGKSQLDFFADSPDKLRRTLAEEGIDLVGPKKAFLVQGEDTVGALVEHHVHLAQAGINVLAANGVSDGKGRFGYVIWVSPEHFEKAAEILGC
jgi:hypothetical protein